MTRFNRTYIAELVPYGSTARGQARKAETVERQFEARNAAEAQQYALQAAAMLSKQRGIQYNVLDVYGV